MLFPVGIWVLAANRDVAESDRSTVEDSNVDAAASTAPVVVEVIGR